MVGEVTNVSRQAAYLTGTAYSPLHADLLPHRRSVGPIQLRLRAPVTTHDRALAELVAHTRPAPFRAFDQIPMRTEDLARQGRLVAPLLAGQKVAFVGDMDGTASLLGLIAAAGGPAPAALLLLDFDERVLEAALLLARQYGFANMLTTRLYNCFDPIPSDLVGKSDWFYTNPPYGSRNGGASARLFLTRGCELVRTHRGSGCLIFPDDASRPWTCHAMHLTRQFLCDHGWTVSEQVNHLHRYDLDDDPELPSSLIIFDSASSGSERPMPFAGRRVGADEIPYFYGHTTCPPYPGSISRAGALIGAVAA